MISRSVQAAIERSNIIFAELVRCADKGLPCPTNPTLAEVLDVESLTTITTAMRRLVDRGLISNKRVPAGRVVTILSTGRSTAPGQSPDKRDYMDGTGAADHKPEPVRVNRDPCPLCAVRADIGCRHSRAAAKPFWPFYVPSHSTEVTHG
jgi:hypothetical protein